MHPFRSCQFVASLLFFTFISFILSKRAIFLGRNCLFAALFVGTCKHTLIYQYYILIYLFTVHYSDCLHAKITCCWWVWLLPVRASGQRGGNVGLGYEKLIFAILRFCDHCLWSRHASVPSVQDHLRGEMRFEIVLVIRLAESYFWVWHMTAVPCTYIMTRSG